jgi:cyanophycinase
LFTGAVVDQNFSSHAGRLERLTDLLRNGATLDRMDGIPGVERRTIGLGVERDTVLVLQGNTVRALGAGRGHLFLKSNGDRTITWQTLSAGEEPLTLQTSSQASQRDASQTNEPMSECPNPFGIPEPIDRSRPGTVVLHGGGSTREIIDMLPTLAGVEKPRLVHCPAARESCRPSPQLSPQEFDQHLERVFAPWRQLQIAGRLAELTFLTTNNAADADRPDFVRPLGQADALWFCGGDQAPLAQLFVDPLRPTQFQQGVYDILRRGGVVGGSSAGLAIMADVMIEGGDPQNGRPAEARLERGLGTMKYVLAEQHFDARSGRIERLTSLLRDHKRLSNFSPTCRPQQFIALAVEEDTALIVKGNELRVTGKKFAHVFLQSSDPRRLQWHALYSGDMAVIKKRNNDYILQLEDWTFR